LPSIRGERTWASGWKKINLASEWEKLFSWRESTGKRSSRKAITRYQGPERWGKVEGEMPECEGKRWPDGVRAEGNE